MTRVLNSLYRDEAGFIVSAELVLVATITVIGLIVGLSEISININNELEDVGSAFASVTQSFSYSGACGCKGSFSGSRFCDQADQCDGQFDINCDHSSSGESSHGKW